MAILCAMIKFRDFDSAYVVLYGKGELEGENKRDKMCEEAIMRKRILWDWFEIGCIQALPCAWLITDYLIFQLTSMLSAITRLIWKVVGVGRDGRISPESQRLHVQVAFSW